MKGCTLSNAGNTGSGDVNQYDVWVGVDGSNIFQVFAESTSSVHVYITGYLTGGFEFLSQPVRYTISVDSTWTDIDFSADIPASALGVILLIREDDEHNFGLRNDGCTDNLYTLSKMTSLAVGAIMGCTSRVVEYYAADASYTYIYLLGYITSAALATFTTVTKTDYSTATVGSYTDLTALPAGAAVGIFEAGYTGSTTYQMALRKNGSSFDQYKYISGRQWFTVEGDSERLVEGKIENAAVDFYLVGYFAPPNGGGNAAGIAMGDCMII